MMTYETYRERIQENAVRCPLTSSPKSAPSTASPTPPLLHVSSFSFGDTNDETMVQCQACSQQEMDGITDSNDGSFKSFPQIQGAKKMTTLVQANESKTTFLSPNHCITLRLGHHLYRMPKELLSQPHSSVSQSLQLILLRLLSVSKLSFG